MSCVIYRPNEDTMFSVGGSFGGGENMINAGVSLKIGDKVKYISQIQFHKKWVNAKCCGMP